MKTPSKGAMYLDAPESDPKVKARTRNPLTGLILMVLAAAVFLVAMPLSSPLAEPQTQTTTTADAWGLPLFCGDGLGSGMDSRTSWYLPFINSDFPADDVSNRTVTAQEAFGWQLFFTNYYGERAKKDPDAWTKDPKRDWESWITGGNELDKAKERIENARRWENCTFSSGFTGLANMVFMNAKITTSVVSGFVGYAFSSSLVCEEAKGTDDNCVDLLFITGGVQGGEQGLIGALTNSLYYPLLIMVVLLVGCWVAYTGLVQRKLREAMWGAIWTVAAVVFGLAFLTQPWLLAKAPAVVSNTIAGCVISAFGGDPSCTGTNIDDSDYAKSVCRASSPNTPRDESLAMVSTSLNCSIWKAFVLEPYAQASFGTSFENLWVGANGSQRGNDMISNAGVSAETFCIRMATSGKLSSYKGKELKLDVGPKMCNIALYQLYLQSTVTSDGNGPDLVQSGSSYIDKRWYPLIRVAAENEATWTSWSGASMTSAPMKVLTSMVAFLSSIVGGFVLAVIAVFAILYYFSAIFMMAFAPIFFLIGVHPGKGRDILKGYGEQVLSNVFKYIASALFLVISLALYGGVLGASTSPGMTLLLVLVLSLALFMYRKEVVELIGTVNMGGQQVGKAFKEKMSSKFSLTDKDSDLRRLGSTTVSTGIGSMVAGGRLRDGLAEGMQREIKREGGLMGRMGAGYERGREHAGRHNKQLLANEGKDLATDANTAKEAAKMADGDLNKAKSEYDKAAKNIEDLNNEIALLAESVRNKDNRKAVLSDMSRAGGDSAKFARAMNLSGEVANMNRQLTRDQAAGLDTSELRQKIASREAERNQIAGELQRAGALNQYQQQYKDQTKDFTEESRKLNAKVDERKAAQAYFDNAATNLDMAAVRAGQATANAAAASEISEAFNDAASSVRPGKVVDMGVMRDVREEARSSVDPAGVAAATQAQIDRLRSQADATVAQPVQKEKVMEASDLTNFVNDGGDAALPGIDVQPESPAEEKKPLPVDPRVPVDTQESLFDEDKPLEEQYKDKSAPPRGGIPTRPTNRDGNNGGQQNPPGDD